jgi:hypothetical protein
MQIHSIDHVPIDDPVSHICYSSMARTFITGSIIALAMASCSLIREMTANGVSTITQMYIAQGMIISAMIIQSSAISWETLKQWREQRKLHDRSWITEREALS